jgi:hypothetical protein
MTCSHLRMPDPGKASMVTDALPDGSHVAVSAVLAYFAIFRHPLTAAEVCQWIGANGPQLAEYEVESILEDLVRSGSAHKYQHNSPITYYQADADAQWLPQRLDANQRADAYLPHAHRMSRFIMRFPFVRAVLVSGSLSKHTMKPDGDIDFFIITSPKRLWLTRTLMVLFKKIILLNSHKLFCINYFVDTEHLCIEEQNRFTATEVVTLLPMQGRDWYDQFVAANAWAWSDYYPNFEVRSTENIPPDTPPSGLKRWMEWLLGGRAGAWFDTRAMRLTVGFWRRKFSSFDQQTFDLALKSRRYVSKHHPLGFQQRVLRAFEERMGRLA